MSESSYVIGIDLGTTNTALASTPVGEASDPKARPVITTMAVPQIVQCHSTTGESDYVMTVLAPDIKRYEQFLHDTVFRLPGVAHVRSAIVLKEVKSEVRLPLPQPLAAPASAKAAAAGRPRRRPAA